MLNTDCKQYILKILIQSCNREEALLFRIPLMSFSFGFLVLRTAKKNTSNKMINDKWDTIIKNDREIE